MNKNERALARAIKAAGNISALARALKINRQAVQAWNAIPPTRCIEIEKLTGIPRAELRADIFA